MGAKCCTRPQDQYIQDAPQQTIISKQIIGGIQDDIAVEDSGNDGKEKANKLLHGSDDTAQFQGKFAGPNNDQINH